MIDRSRLVTIIAIVFVDLLGFSLILPLLPFYASDFGANPTQVGLLVATYAAGQLVGSPVLGRLSDRFGRRPVLLLSILGTFIGFLMLGFATTLWMLFVSRLLDGVTGGNVSVAQAYIADVTDEEERAKGLGLVGAAFGLGFIVGPAVGGLLSVWGYGVPAFLAAGLSALNLVAVAFLLPESLSREDRRALAARPRPSLSLRGLWNALNKPKVGPLFLVRFLYSLAFSTFTTIFPLYAQYRLNLNAQATGLVLTYVGVLIVLVQGVAVGWLTSRFSELRLIAWSNLLMMLAMVGWAITPSLALLLVVLAPLALSGGVLNTVVNSALSKSVDPLEVGGALGLSASLESLTRVVSPSLGGVLLEQVGAWAPGVFGALIMAWLVAFSWRQLPSARESAAL
ncbi:MAG: MFS transporter [Anaerolineales bacterium]|jgi:DHA1 family tetracycline resistance protein-like MFS transporter